MMHSQPSYTSSPLKSVNALCRDLKRTESFLRSIADRVPKLYIGPKQVPKKNGRGYRNVFDTKAPLKPLLKQINDLIFSRIEFPPFLNGSLPGREFLGHVEVHAGSKATLTFDIEKFFDNVNDRHVYDVWTRGLKFGPGPGELLTALTTNGGRLYQGAPTSSYLANLVFWRYEGELVERLATKGMKYTRYVDDIIVSSPAAISSELKTWVVAQVIGMLGAYGFRTAREKQEIMSNSQAMTVMNVNLNSKRPTLTKGERSAVRAHLHKVETIFDRGEMGADLRIEISRVSGRLGRVARLHPGDAAKGRARLDAMKLVLQAEPVVTMPPIAAPQHVVAEGMDEPPF